MTVGCCFTPVSVWDGYYVSFDHVALDTYPFWTRPINQRWPALLDDASDTASRLLPQVAANPSHLLDGIVEVWFLAFRRFIPLLPVENQSWSRG